MFWVNIVNLVIVSDVTMRNDTEVKERLVYGDFVKQMEHFKEYSGYNKVPWDTQKY